MNSTAEIQYVNRIIDAVCIEFEVPREMLFGKSREQHYTYLRHCVIYLIKRILNINISTSKLGELTNRDHATMLHSTKVAANLIVTDNNEFVKLMNRVIKSGKEVHKELNNIAQL